MSFKCLKHFGNHCLSYQIRLYHFQVCELMTFMITRSIVRNVSCLVPDEMEALRQRNLQLAERELAPGNNDRGLC